MREPRRDHYRKPEADDDTDTVARTAIDSLGALRGFACIEEDAAARLHLLASVMAGAGRRLPRAVADARDQGCSWAHIGDLLGVTRATAQQRYGAPQASHKPVDPD